MPGKWNLRCNDVVLAAMMAHPDYANAGDFARRLANSVNKGKWSLALYLPAALARTALEPTLSEILGQQQPNGLWFRKDASWHSYGILMSLKHSGLLDEVLADGRMRYATFQAFNQCDEIHAYLVRRNIIEKPLPSDRRLQRKLVGEITDRQQQGGGWSDSVAATALQSELLLELGIDPEHRSLRRARSWMLEQFCPVAERRRPGANWGVTIQDMITADSWNEFRQAQNLLPQMKLANSCFCSVPIVQTSLALRQLVRLGAKDDPRVHRAYRSLLALEIKPHEKQAGRTKLVPGWCSHQCRFKLEAIARGTLKTSGSPSESRRVTNGQSH